MLACTKKKGFLNLDKRIHSFDKNAELAINKRANVSCDEQKFLKKIKDITNYGWKSKFLSNNKEKDLSFYKLYCNDSLSPVNDRIKILKRKSEKS